MGPLWIWSHQKNVLNLVRELGLELFTQFTEGNALYDSQNSLEVFTPQAAAPSAEGAISLAQDISEKLHFEHK